MHDHFSYGIAFYSLFHVVVACGGVYLLYSISKSLKRIADKLDKNEQKIVTDDILAAP